MSRGTAPCCWGIRGHSFWSWALSHCPPLFSYLDVIGSLSQGGDSVTSAGRGSRTARSPVSSKAKTLRYGSLLADSSSLWAGCFCHCCGDLLVVLRTVCRSPVIDAQLRGERPSSSHLSPSPTSHTFPLCPIFHLSICGPNAVQGSVVGCCLFLSSLTFSLPLSPPSSPSPFPC